MKDAQVPMPKRPFRDTAIFYGVLAVIFVAAIFPAAVRGQR